MQPSSKRTTACVAAAEYLPANCGTAPVDVADVLSGHCGQPDRCSTRTPPSPSSGVGVSDCGPLVLYRTAPPPCLLIMPVVIKF